MKLPRPRVIAVSSCALMLAATAGLLVAGPLNPPGGPIGATMKTLAEVEPRIALSAANTPGDADSIYKITQPGSYYLTGNLTGVAGKHGIEITASNVSLDLGGMHLDGSTPGTFHGIYTIGSGLSNVAVFNGTVSGWGGAGVHHSINGTIGGRVERIHSNSNGLQGFVVGNSSSVSDCSAYDNAGDGFVIYSGCVVRDCESRANAGDGFDFTGGVSLSGCAAYANTGTGFVASTFSANTLDHCIAYSNLIGISLASGSSVLDCTAVANNIDGVRVSSRCTVRGNTCLENGASDPAGAGVRTTGADNRVEANHCALNDIGYAIKASGNALLRNSATGNSVLNWSIVSGNTFLIVSAPASAALDGNAGGSGYGSTDPNANITY
ncbi:MAG: right-handed parallel beta-helix repeat-containing protein [Phycisphaerae bacterium]|nr:right-handed parallel beta-helix repeat-containing protein [Phycisphaerae bacterium]